MLKQLAIALALGCGLSAGAAMAQQNPNQGEQPDRNWNQKQNQDKTHDNDENKDSRFEAVPKGVLQIPQGQLERVRDGLAQQGYKEEGGKFNSLADLSGSIRRFQEAKGLPVTGNLDLRTVKALGLDALVVVDPKVEGAHYMLGEGGKNVGTMPAGLPKGTPVVGAGKSPVGYIVLGDDQIDKIEDQLAAEGYVKKGTFGTLKEKVGMHGAITPDFVEAIRRFQRAHGIQSEGGLLDVATLAAMPKLDIRVDVAQSPAIQLPGATGDQGSFGSDRSDRRFDEGQSNPKR
jgi:peptidoglycan hydrolase-like protein with peptidoglycan-binding domain